MKHTHIYLHTLIVTIFLTAFSSCINDSFTTSPSAQPTPSVDTLCLGTLFTGEPTPTYSFKLINRNHKAINISHISFRDDTDGLFRLNVDGLPGTNFNNVELRARDSIFIFVEATLPDLQLTTPTLYKRHLDITTNGITSTVVITATGLDATRLTGHTITADAVFTAQRPYIIYDSLIVASGATLTLEPGTNLHFHDRATLRVDGSLHANGTPEANIQFIGDRFGSVVGRVDYEIMSGQWDGIYFTPTSHDNYLNYASIRNTTNGVTVDSVPYTTETPSLAMLNSQLHNSKSYSLVSYHSAIEAIGCELTDASLGVIALQGGTARLINCTIANYYLFSILGGPALQFYHTSHDDAQPDTDLPFLSATIINSIIYGNGNDLSHTDLAGTDITLNHTLLKSSGQNDNHFIDCFWDIDPLYGTVRQDYHFDYRLKPESPAIGTADPELIPPSLTNDRYGTPLDPEKPILGAYTTPLPTNS